MSNEPTDFVVFDQDHVVATVFQPFTSNEHHTDFVVCDQNSNIIVFPSIVKSFLY